MHIAYRRYILFCINLSLPEAFVNHKTVFTCEQSDSLLPRLIAVLWLCHTFIADQLQQKSQARERR